MRGRTRPPAHEEQMPDGSEIFAPSASIVGTVARGTVMFLVLCLPLADDAGRL